MLTKKYSLVKKQENIPAIVSIKPSAAKFKLVSGQQKQDTVESKPEAAAESKVENFIKNSPAQNPFTYKKFKFVAGQKSLQTKELVDQKPTEQTTPIVTGKQIGRAHV